MMVKKIYAFLMILFFLGIPTYLFSQENSEKINKESRFISSVSAMVKFSYINEDLVNIINYIAGQKGINIILPIGAQALNVKVTLSMGEEISLDEAWSLIATILDIAGYVVVEHDAMFVIAKKEQYTMRHAYPLFIGTAVDDLPSTDDYIRYLYYFANMKITNDMNNEVSTILTGLLPSMPPLTIPVITLEPASNAVVVTAKARDIQAIIPILTYLDQVQFQEKIEILPLRYSSAYMVADLINENLLKSGAAPNRYRLDTRKQSESSYFSKAMKVMAYDRRNALILVGKQQAVDRMIEFVKQHIDTEPKTGQSILHVYPLQYLDAEGFAPVLERIVTSARTGGTEQSRAGGPAAGGTERFFDEVIIRPDKPANAEESKYYGGNKLIIACRNDDWVQIKKLIEDLDSPQPQVLIEVLVADLTIDDTRLLGAMTRNPQKIPILNTMQFQSAQLQSNILPNSYTDPTTIASDLLRNSIDSSGNPADPPEAVNSIAILAPAGTTLLSLSDNDGQTWSLLEMLKLFSYSKVLSHPHVMATNGKQATVKIGQERFIPDELSVSVAPVRKNKKIRAELVIDITPRISGDTVNLQVKVSINDFLPGASSDNAQTTREVDTSANVLSGSIFALGGLVRLDTTQSTNKTPVLADVPIIGWFFKKRQNHSEKNNLTVFISPTIIQPRLRKGVGDYTRDYMSIAREYASENGLFESLKDPITRWFFSDQDNDPAATIDDFLTKGDLLDNIGVKDNKPSPETRDMKNIITPTKADEDVVVAPEDLAVASIPSFNKEACLARIKEQLNEDDNPFRKMKQVVADEGRDDAITAALRQHRA
jgi:general secretion pathway protein D